MARLPIVLGDGLWRASLHLLGAPPKLQAFTDQRFPPYRISLSTGLLR